jgi:hypothetical protein
MKTVELYARVRHAVQIEGISERAAADRFGINARTVSKMMKFSVPPGYVRKKPPFRPKLDAFTGIIDAMFKLGQCAEKKWRRLRGFDYLTKVMTGVKFKDGVEVTELDLVAA